MPAAAQARGQPWGWRARGPAEQLCTPPAPELSAVVPRWYLWGGVPFSPDSRRTYLAVDEPQGIVLEKKADQGNLPPAPTLPGAHKGWIAQDRLLQV